MSHRLHKVVAEGLAALIPPCQLLRDQACGGSQQLPLFLGASKSRESELCDVDLLVLQNGLVKVIVEIDKSNIKPTQLCGKFLTSALASHFIHKSHGNKPLEKSDAVLFLQIVHIPHFPLKTAKKLQMAELRKAIQEILPIGRITQYQIFQSDTEGVEKAAACIKAFCDPMPS